MTKEEHLMQILACAWQFDDKPHLLFRAITYAAEAFENEEVADEIRQLMEAEISQKANARNY